MPRAPRRLFSALLAAPLVVACAGGPPGGPGPGDAPPMAPAAPLFISPFGEPFQGRPEGPWPSAAWFAGADTDNDGALTFAEFEADGWRWFAALDLNGDGQLGPAELATHEADLSALRGAGGGPERGRARGRDGATPGQGDDGPRARIAQSGPPGGGAQSGPPGGGRGQGGARGRGGPGGARGYGRIAEAGWFNLPLPVRAFDANLNQTVTAEEWAERTNRLFLTLDADRDGRLTLDTLPQTPLQQAAARAEAKARR